MSFRLPFDMGCASIRRVEPEQMRQPDNLPAFCRVHRNRRPLIGTWVRRRSLTAGHVPGLLSGSRLELGRRYAGTSPRILHVGVLDCGSIMTSMMTQLHRVGA